MIQTHRLLLRPFTIQDAPFMLRLVNEPSWLEYIGDRNVHTIPEAEAYLENGAIKNYRELGYGFWMVEMKDTHEQIGTCGLTKRTYLDHPDIGFAFFPQYTGLGFALEAANATIEYARSVLQLPALYAYSLPENIRSIRLLEKLNFMYDRVLRIEDEPLSLYRLDL